MMTVRCHDPDSHVALLLAAVQNQHVSRNTSIRATLFCEVLKGERSNGEGAFRSLKLHTPLGPSPLRTLP